MERELDSFIDKENWTEKAKEMYVAQKDRRVWSHEG